MSFIHIGFYSKYLCNIAAAGTSLRAWQAYFLHEILLGLTTSVMMVTRLSIPVLCYIRQCRTVSFSWDKGQVWYGTKTSVFCNTVGFLWIFSSGGSSQRIMLYLECILWLGNRRLAEKLKTLSVPFLLLCSLPTVISCFMAFIAFFLCKRWIFKQVSRSSTGEEKKYEWRMSAPWSLWSLCTQFTSDGKPVNNWFPYLSRSKVIFVKRASPG